MAKCEKAYDLMKEGSKIITEAVHNKTNKRHDLVDITLDEIYEFETTKARAKRFEGLPINVIMVK